MKRILLLGESIHDGSARYLMAILKWSKIPFDYRPDAARIPKNWRKKDYGAVILSDYRYASFTPCAREWLIESVHRGTGLFMIGGWASFTGLVGCYAGTSIEKLLPIHCVAGDDRVHHSAVLESTGSPIVCGYHRCKPKKDSEVVLHFRNVLASNGRFRLGTRHPAFVIGRAGQGRSAAFLTDCAPHWAGGLVDWGKRRVRISLAKNGTVEVGSSYLEFFKRWILWVSKSR
jgi:uncharacterized membrane protein